MDTCIGIVTLRTCKEESWYSTVYSIAKNIIPHLLIAEHLDILSYGAHSNSNTLSSWVHRFLKHTLNKDSTLTAKHTLWGFASFLLQFWPCSEQLWDLKQLGFTKCILFLENHRFLHSTRYRVTRLMIQKNTLIM